MFDNVGLQITLKISISFSENVVDFLKNDVDNSLRINFIK